MTAPVPVPVPATPPPPPPIVYVVSYFGDDAVCVPGVFTSRALAIAFAQANCPPGSDVYVATRTLDVPMLAADPGVSV